MKLKSPFLSLAAIALLAATAMPLPTVRAEDIKLSATPPLVQATIQQYQRDGKVEDVETKTAEGQTWYEAEVKLANDRDLKIHVRADGSLIKTSEEIALTEVPPVVQDAANKAVPTGKVDKVHRVITNGLTTTYKIEIDRSGADDVKLEITETGTVLGKEKD